MRRLFAIAASVAILLLAIAPAAFAADPVQVTGHGAVITVNGTVDVPAGQAIDAVVVVNGTASVAGAVDTVVVVRGSATLTGATVRSLVVVDGTASLGAGTTVTGNVATLHATVNQDPGAVVMGRTTSLETNLAMLTLLAIPLMIVFTVGFGLAMIAAGLLVAAFGSRQVREAEALITQRPGQTLVAGIAGSVVLPVLAGILVMTVIGAPIGLAGLFLVLPVLALVGWLVAAIWIGDWLIARSRGTREPGRPYRAAVLGVIVLAAAGLLPFVSGLATLFGFGALLLAAWHTLRPETAGTVRGHARDLDPAGAHPRLSSTGTTDGHPTARAHRPDPAAGGYDTVDPAL